MNIHSHHLDSGKPASENGGSAVACNEQFDAVLKQWGVNPQNVHVKITDDIRAALFAHKERTGLTPEEFLQCGTNAPDDLTVYILKGWLWGKTANARLDHLQYVLDTWENLPRKPEHHLIQINKTLREELQKQKSRTGVSAISLLQQDSNKPDGVTHRLVNRWLSGMVTQAHPAHIEYVLNRWKSLPDSGRVEITHTMRATLHAHKQRTGVGPRGLFRYMESVPEGLYYQTITAWLIGKIKSAQKSHFACVLHTWERMESNSAIRKSLSLSNGREQTHEILAGLPSKDHVAITREIRNILHMHINRSGVWPHTLLKDADSVPEGLDSLTVHGWLSQQSKTARKDHLQYVLQKWQALPDICRRN